MTYKTKTRIKGFATVSVALALSIGITIIGGITTFYNVKGNTDKEIGELTTEVAVERTRVDNVETLLEKIDGKLDKLLLKE